MSNQTKKIWDSFNQRLSRFIAHRVSNKADAEDLLQEVFLKLHKNIDTLEDSEKLPQWIFSVTRNAITDYYRKKGTNKETSFNDYQDIQNSDYKEDFKQLKSCLHSFKKTMPENYKEVVELSDFQGVKQKEIAKRLGLSLPAVKSRVRRGRKMIKQHFVDCCKFEFDHNGNFTKGDLENPQCSDCP